MTITADAIAREVEPAFVPDMAIRGFRWVMDDSWKDQLVEGLVVKVEVVLRLEGRPVEGDRYDPSGLPRILGELRMARLCLLVEPSNDRSQRVAERSGFVKEGVLRSYEDIGGRRVDCVVFSLVPADLGWGEETR